MRKFTDDDVITLAPYEEKLRKAYYSRYITGITKEDWEVVYSVFKDTIGTTGMHYGCGYCEVYVFGKIGKLYFKRMEEMKEKEEKEDGTTGE